MAATPEGRVKAKVRKVLEKYPHWGFWPVPTGYGRTSLDYIGCINGRFFAIETKAPGKKPTPLQEQTMKQMMHSGGIVFLVVGGEEGEALRSLDIWLACQREIH